MNGQIFGWRAALAAGVLAITTMSAAAQDVVKVGMSGPFSGGLSLLGQSVRDGVEAEQGDAVCGRAAAARPFARPGGQGRARRAV